MSSKISSVFTQTHFVIACSAGTAVIAALVVVGWGWADAPIGFPEIEARI